MDIIKDKSKQSVKNESTELNKEQIEESQKKTISKKSSAEKLLNTNKDESPVAATFRDYSGRIKYDNINSSQKNQNSKDNSIESDNHNLIESETSNTGIIKDTTDNSNIVKSEINNTGIIKPDNSSDTYKHSSIISNNKNNRETDHAKFTKRKILNTLRKINIDKTDVSNTTNYNETLNDGAYKAGENLFQYIEDKPSQINIINEQVSFDISSLSIDVISHSQREILSRSTKDYLSAVKSSSTSIRSAYSKLMHKKIINELKTKKSYSFQYSDSINNTSAYNDAITDVKTNDYIINESENSVINDLDYAFKYVNDNKNSERVINTSSPTTIGEPNYTHNTKSVNANNLKIHVSSSAIKNSVNTLSNKSNRITKGERRKKIFNRTSTEAKTKQYGVKPLNSNKYKGSVLNVGDKVQKIANVAGTAFVNNIKTNISESAESDMGIKAINDSIRTIDTIKSVNRGINVISRSGSKITKGAVNTSKSIYNEAKKLKNFTSKIQKFKQLSKKQRNKIIAKTIKVGIKQSVHIVLAAAKGVAMKFLGIAIAVLLLLVIIIVAVVAIIGSVVWQTSSDLDTTQIVKYISELDYNQQKDWFNKGKTNIEIEKQQDNSSSSIGYYYIIAENVPDDIESADGSIPTESDMHCIVKTGFSSSGNQIRPSYSGFNKVFRSSDEMLEEYRWTTDDYRAALAYLQVKNDNLGWFANLIGFVGEMQLKNSAAELHELTYSGKIIEKYVDSDDTSYSYQDPIYSVSYSNPNTREYYYFGRKYSVNYLIENNMIRFDDDDIENERQKELYTYTYKYGNFAVGNLSFPLDLNSDEVISDRIAKSFGKQLVLKFTPSELDDNDEDVYGSVTSYAGYHYAVDLKADAGDNIYAPISGFCTSVLKTDRGYEVTISTSYNGNNIDYSRDGYLVKLSCISNINISTNQMVKQGDLIGKVGSASVFTINHTSPSIEDDIFASKLFPCNTGTTYHELGSNDYNEPTPEYDHLHIEMYKLPCNFSDITNIENNVLDPELFFDYSNEIN